MPTVTAIFIHLLLLSIVRWFIHLLMYSSDGKARRNTTRNEEKSKTQNLTLVMSLYCDFRIDESKTAYTNSQARSKTFARGFDFPPFLSPSFLPPPFLLPSPPLFLSLSLPSFAFLPSRSCNPARGSGGAP